MIQNFRLTYPKILFGILMPVFLFIFAPHRLQTEFRLRALDITTTDPFFTSKDTDPDKQWYLPKTKILDAWGYSKGSNNVTVAIIDTGIHASHIELNDGRVISGFNTITNQAIPASSDSDDNGHGTAVAGVIGAIPNNGKGIVGINWNIKLMPIKALAADGTGDISTVAAGIVWAADHGANIINLSLGGEGFPADINLSAAITYAFQHNVLVVAAAGNDNADQGLNLDVAPVYPICADNGQNMVLGVTATDVNDQKANFSDFGHNCVDISAPGKRILTTAFIPSDPSNNVLIYGSGTSMAAPVVSGIAALVKSVNPNYTNVDLENVLMKTADNIDPLNQTACSGGNCNGFLGSGRVNALRGIVPQPILNGSLVREALSGNIYSVSNNTKRLVSSFVMNQRGLDPNKIINDTHGQLANFILGSALPPLDGTLIKVPDDPEVYIILQELKHPLTYLVFISRGLKFSDIKIVSQTDINSYAEGDWYWPPDDTTVLIKGNPLVFVMNQQVAKPVTYFVFIQRHLSFNKIISVSLDEFLHLPRSTDIYWLAPVDGTLVKSDTASAVYIIQNGTKVLLSAQAFFARGYSFRNVKTLPESEIAVIAPGGIIGS